MQPFFTNNDSDFTALEGLYIKERNPPAAISGANLNQTGVVGECVRGPVDKPVLISNEARFKEVFGERDYGSGGSIIGKVWLALLNKPFGNVYVVRAAAAGATTAQLTLNGATQATGTVTFPAASSLASGDTVTVSDGVNTIIFELRKTGAAAGGHVKVDISSAVTGADVAAAFAAQINAEFALGPATFTINGSSAAAVCNLVNAVAGTAGNVAITTSNVAITVSGMSGAVASAALLTVAASSPGFWGNNLTATIQAATDGNADHFNLNVSYLGNTVVYKNLDISQATPTVADDNTLSVVGTDDGRLVTLTKLASGVPSNVTGLALSGGSDGTIADSDFTASGRGINPLVHFPGLGCVFIAERSSSVLNAYVTTVQAGVSDRVFPICPNSSTVGVTAAATDAGNYRSDRIIYCYNHPYTIDPQVAAEVLTNPTAWMASILSQIDVDIHPGEEDTKQFTAGIERLSQPALARGDYITLKNAGISALEQDDGFDFVSGLTTSLVPGKEQITRRRMTDFLQLSIAQALKHVVKKKDTETRKQAAASMIDSFLADLQKAERVVEDFNVDPHKLNTPTQEGLGLVKILVQVRLLSHILYLDLETLVGTSVVVQQAA